MRINIRQLKSIKFFLKYSDTRSVSIMVLLPTLLSIIILISFFSYLSNTKSDVLFTNIAGRQRLLSEQMGATAHMVHVMGHDGNRDSLRKIITTFDQSLDILQKGGMIEGQYIQLSHPAIQPDLERVDLFWRDLKPHLLLLADRPIIDPQAIAAYALIEEQIPELRVLSNSVVLSYESLRSAHDRQMVWVIIVVITLNFILLLTGFIVIKRYLENRNSEANRLSETEKKFRHIFENATEGIYQSTIDGRLIIVNPTLADILGYNSPEELVKININVSNGFYVNPDQRKEFLSLMKQENRLTGYEYEIYKNNGDIIWVSENARVVRNNNNEMVGFEGTIVDITKRKKAEGALAIEEETNRLILNSVEEIIYMVTLSKDAPMAGEIKYVSQKSEEIIGYTYKEFINNPNLWFELVHPEDIPLLSQTTEQIVSSGKNSVREYRMRHKSGEYRWFSDHVVPQRDNDDVIGFFGVARDVTERKQADAQLQKLSQVFLDGTVPVIIEDLEGVVQDMNDEAVILYGWPREELIGKPIKMLVPNARHAQADELLERCRTGKIVRNVEAVRLQQGGIEMPILLTLSLLTDEEDNPIGIASIATDITERRQAEEEISKSHKQLRALAKRLQTIREEEKTSIARELHDQLGHSLTALKIDLTSLAKKVDLNDKSVIEEVESMISMTSDSIDTVKRITTELRPGILDHLGLGATFKWQVKEFADRTKINYECVIPKTLKGLNKEKETTFYRILQESLTNVARHAEAKKIKVTLNQSGQSIVLSVQDDGKGFEEAKVDSLKSLGLVGMRERAYAVGGELTIQGSLGKGTTVTVSVPVG
ncbi:MAG: PAS domain S-box protein [Candidatus Marinimicrobia bacterium]|nr:PAS domain S-box protein [Candidatus Neomarinimicrobiota bacterium]